MAHRLLGLAMFLSLVGMLPLAAGGQALTAVSVSTGNLKIRLIHVTNVGAGAIDAATIPGDPKLYIATYSPPTAPKVVVVDPTVPNPVATPFLDLASVPLTVSGARLQGIVFSPNFTDQTKPGYHKFYTYTQEPTPASPATDVMYIHPEYITSPPLPSVAVLREWTANAAGTAIDISVPSRIVLNFGIQGLHIGGGMKFGPDGYLYLSTGEGQGNGNGFSGSLGNAGDGFTGRNTAASPLFVPYIGNAQDPTNPLGKVLRIDPYVFNGDGTPRPAPAGAIARTFKSQTVYFVPQSNPFVGNPQNIYFTPIGPASAETPIAPMEEIFAIGFRNPWKLSFDKNAVAGDRPYVADVGSRTREEIVLVEAGKNYGWPYREGFVASETAAANRPVPVPFLKKTGTNTYTQHDLDATLTDPAQMAFPIAELGTRVGSATPLLFGDRPGFDTFNDGVFGDAYGDTNAVVGGFIYRGSAVPALTGLYVFGGYQYLKIDPSRVASTTPQFPTAAASIILIPPKSSRPEQTRRFDNSACASPSVPGPSSALPKTLPVKSTSCSTTATSPESRD